MRRPNPAGVIVGVACAALLILTLGNIVMGLVGGIAAGVAGGAVYDDLKGDD